MFWFFRTHSCYVTLIYRKPTFTSLYTRWDSFCPTKQKINLIKTLTPAALIICSESKLDDEIKCFSTTLCNNRFLLNVVQTIIIKKIKLASVERCPVCLRLPRLSGISDLASCAEMIFFSQFPGCF